MIRKIYNAVYSTRNFYAFCKKYNLILDYKKNKKAIPIAQEIFHQRIYSSYFPFYEQATIIDVGAHFGYFSLFAHQHTAPQSKLISIEPNIDNYQVLLDNLLHNKASNCIPILAALSHEPGSTQLHIGKHSENNSLIKDYSMLSTGSQNVDAFTLVQICEKHKLENIDFLKLDCEGSEYTILEHLPDELFRKIKVVSMEFHDLKDSHYNAKFLIKLLQSHHFTIVKCEYSPTNFNLNFGYLVATGPSY